MPQFFHSKKVLVTGATGFLGSHLTRRLVAQGADVRILRRDESSLALLEDVETETAVGDIRDQDAVRRAVAGCEYVFHVAGAVSYWPQDRAWLEAVNVGGTENVIAACLDANVARLIHTSSTAAIGKPEEMTHGTESLAFDWQDHEFAYMATKFLGETRVREARDELDVVVVNPACIIGPGDWRHFGPMADRVRRGFVPGYPGGGGNFVDVGDVAAGHLLAAENGVNGERYILGGDNHTWRELLVLINKHFGRKPGFPLSAGPMKAAAGCLELVGRLTGRRPDLTREMVLLGEMDLYYSSEKAYQVLGYRWQSIGERLFHALSWYEEHGFHAP